MMNSRTLWHTLLHKPISHPLLLKSDPHLPQPINIIANGWTLFVFFGTLAFVTLTPFISLTDGIGLRVASLVAIAVFIPIAIFYFVGVMLSPYTLMVGIFQGFNTCLQVSKYIEKLYKSQQIDMISVTPSGRDGAFDATGAAIVRSRQDNFYITNIYERVTSHFILSLALMAGIGVVYAASAPPTNLYNSSALTDKLLIAGYQFIPTFIVALIGTALVHLDFRQLLTLGVTAGIYGTARFRHLFGAQIAAAITFGVVLIAGSLAIAFCGVAFTQLIPLKNYVAVGIGYALALLLREVAIRWMWREIETNELR